MLFRSQDHDNRRRVDLALRRPRDALHLVANFAEELPGPAEPAQGALRFRSTFARLLYRFGAHRRRFSAPQSTFAGLPAVAHARADTRERRLAGQEGIEPPTPGFGDRCSAN